jgi:hypothetical protein
MKIRLVGVELFYSVRRTDRYTDRQTDTKLKVVFRNFANVPSKERVVNKLLIPYENPKISDIAFIYYK